VTITILPTRRAFPSVARAEDSGYSCGFRGSYSCGAAGEFSERLKDKG
jgi:ubiquitin